VSFSDGRALCYLLHHYHPAVLSLADIKTRTSLSCGVGKYDFDNDLETLPPKPEDLEHLFANEKHNFKLLMEKVINLFIVDLNVMIIVLLTGRFADKMFHHKHLPRH